MDKKYLKQASSGLWLYRRKTPTLLRNKYGSDYIQYTLHTHSHHEAIIKRNKINADIEMELHHAKQGNNDKSKFYYYYTPWRRNFPTDSVRATFFLDVKWSQASLPSHLVD